MRAKPDITLAHGSISSGLLARINHKFPGASLGRKLVAQVSNLLYRRFSICESPSLRTVCRMPGGLRATVPTLEPHWALRCAGGGGRISSIPLSVKILS